jgi:enediyne core biosynthesis thioesterase
VVSAVAEHYVYRHRVTFDETNLVGNVYFAHYLHWQGHCREHFLADHAPSVLRALGDTLALVTLQCSAEYYAESVAFDRIELRMSLKALTGNRIAMGFDYVRLDDAGEELLARGAQTVACMRRGEHGLEPAAVPDDLQAALAKFGAQP